MAKLCNSHVVPEFFFSQLYDDTHRFYGLSSIAGEKIRLFQKGLREKLLCPTCETQFSVYEHYAQSVLYGGGTEIEVRDFGKMLQVEGIRYEKFKLFEMSLLWRFSITTLKYFRGIELGTTHQEKLRKMLLAQDAGEPWEYGCTITGLLHEGKVFKDLIAPPALAQIDGHDIYTTAIGGFLLSFVVSNHEPVVVRGGLLQKNGRLVILRKEFTKIPFLMTIGVEVARAKGDKPLPGEKG
jgi:hypothetical protein